jgi:hypothetical protein
MRSVFQASRPLTEPDAGVYIRRQADQAVAARLQQREYLLLIEPPRQGKTSLLRALPRDPVLENMAFAYLDLSDPAFERERAADWYAGVTAAIQRQLEALGFPHLSLPQNEAQWLDTLAELAGHAQRMGHPVVLLCDQVGASLPDAHGFYGAMRSLYTSRYDHPAYKSLVVVLAGSFDPKDLIQDAKLSPFNVAGRVGLDNLSFDQVWRLMQAGNLKSERLYELAQQVYSWTNGQPYLTQKLCSLLDPDCVPETVSAHALALLGEDEALLLPTAAALEGSPALVDYLDRIYTGEKIEFWPRHIRKQSRLELLGVIQGDASGFCQFRSRLHEQVYLQGRSRPAPAGSVRAGDQPRAEPAGEEGAPRPAGPIQVRVDLHNRIYPTAYCYLLDAKADIPFLSLHVENPGPARAVLDVKVVIQGESHEDSELVSLSPGKEQDVPLLPLLTRESMQSLSDLRAASLLVCVEQVEPEPARLYRKSLNIHLQARDVALLGIQQPGGTVIDLTDYLAAWVTYRNGEVETWARKAANRHPQGMLAGYLEIGAAPDGISPARQQVRAIYETLKLDLGLTFISSPFSLGAENGQIAQRVRLPQQSLAAKSANCIDGTVLFASLIAAASMRPLLVILPEHAIVGWYTGNNTGECEFLETTLVGQAGFEEAWSQGQEQFRQACADGSFERGLFDPRGFAKRIDVIACHEKGIFPLPA